MVDFKSAIEQGLAAYGEAVAAKREIETVIERLNSQARPSGVRFFVGNESGLHALGANTLADLVNPLTRPKALYVVNMKKGSPSKRLAGWEEPETGFPCALRFGGSKFECRDKEALERTIGKLLSTAEAGRIISEAVSYEPPQPQE